LFLSWRNARRLFQRIGLDLTFLCQWSPQACLYQSTRTTSAITHKTRIWNFISVKTSCYKQIHYTHTHFGCNLIFDLNVPIQHSNYVLKRNKGFIFRCWQKYLWVPIKMLVKALP
jgi:hypothetical protein